MASRLSRILTKTALSLALALGHANTALGSPTDLFGAGTKAQATAGSGAVTADPEHAAYANPARLSASATHRLSLGWQRAGFSLDAVGAAPLTLRETQLAYTLGLAVPLWRGATRAVAAGISIASPRGGLVRAKLELPEAPQFPILANRGDTFSGWAGLGVQLSETLRLGVGIGLLANLLGDVEVVTEGEQTFTLMQTRLVLSHAPVLGVTYQVQPQLALGIAWSDALTSELDVALRLEGLGSITLPTIHVSGVAQYDPERMEWEAVYELERWSFIVGVRYRRWSRFPGWLGATVRCPAEVEDCGTLPPESPNYRDTTAPRLALMHRVGLGRAVEVEFRGGVTYEPSPVPDQRADSNVFDNDRLVVGLGYAARFVWQETPVELSFAYQRHWLAPRRHDKVDASRVDTNGSVDLLGLGMGATF